MRSPSVVLLAATTLDAKRFLQEWPALRSSALRTVTLHSLDSARGVWGGALFVTPTAKKHPLYERGMTAVAPCFTASSVSAFPPRSRVPKPAEIRRVGGGIAPSYKVADPRGAGVKRAADLLRAAAPVGQVAAVLRDAAKEYTAKVFRHLGPADQVGLERVVSMLPDAVAAAGLAVELPPKPAVFEDEFDDIYVPPRVKRREPWAGRRAVIR